MEDTTVLALGLALGLQLSLQLQPDLDRLEGMGDGDGTACCYASSYEGGDWRRHALSPVVLARIESEVRTKIVRGVNNKLM